MPQMTILFFLKFTAHLLALSPLVWLYYHAFNDTLSADPVEAVIHFTGIGAFNLLLITLSLTPLAKRFKRAEILKCRRLLGLYAFTYALLHLFNFIAFELQFDMSLLLDEIIKRPYITIGMAAFIIMFLLALTSPNLIKRKMGKHWQQLHHWIYLMVILVAIHFYWSVKSEIIEPTIYIIITLFLLSFRGDKLKRWLKRKQ